jgi:hypothetical protein
MPAGSSRSVSYQQEARRLGDRRGQGGRIRKQLDATSTLRDYVMRYVLTILIVLSFTSVLNAQRISLRQAVRQAQRDIGVASLACGGIPPTFQEQAARSMVLVHSVVESALGELSADETKVVTQFTVRPFEVDRRDLPNWPLAPETIVLETEGGTAIVEGFRVSHSVEVLGRRIDLRAGQQVVLLARTRTGPHDLTFDPLSAFTVDNGIVFPMGTAREWPKPTIGDFLAVARTVLGY